jgi:hypothetical protein
VTKGSDLLVAALENEDVACIFAIPGGETIFRLFCLAVFIHVSSRDRHTHTQILLQNEHALLRPLVAYKRPRG